MPFPIFLMNISDFNDVPGEDTCPPLTEGFRVSPSEFKDSIDIGEKAANDYADSMALASRDLERRASKSFDPRGTFRTPRKNQLDTGLCGKPSKDFFTHN